MVAGKWRVNDGSVIGVDMEQLMHRHHAAAMKLGKLAMNNN